MEQKELLIKYCTVSKEGNYNMESVFTSKVKAGKRRTYFFDVRKTKGEDYYITLTESTKRFNGDGVERHKIFVYKEDFNRFQNGLNDAINHVKTELMPDYDYAQYERRHEEWEKEQAEKNKNEVQIEESSSTTSEEPSTGSDVSEEDVSW
jgi:hypothetical protein